MWGRKERWELVKQKVDMHKEKVGENVTKRNKSVSGKRKTKY
jgi:hypothetical protein